MNFPCQLVGWHIFRCYFGFREGTTGSFMDAPPHVLQKTSISLQPIHGLSFQSYFLDETITHTIVSSTSLQRAVSFGEPTGGHPSPKNSPNKTTTCAKKSTTPMNKKQIYIINMHLSQFIHSWNVFPQTTQPTMPPKKLLWMCCLFFCFGSGWIISNQSWWHLVKFPLLLIHSWVRPSYGGPTVGNVGIFLVDESCASNILLACRIWHWMDLTYTYFYITSSDYFCIGQVGWSWTCLMSLCQLIFGKFSKIYMFNVPHIWLKFLVWCDNVI